MAEQNPFIKLIAENAQAKQTLARTPEPSDVMSEEKSVTEYDGAIASNLTANYALSMDLIFRARTYQPTLSQGLALDLCCGPGHLSLGFLQYLEYEKVFGLDLSLEMIACARHNAAKNKLLNRAEFSQKDVREIKVSDFANAKKWTLVSCTNSVHHFADIDSVKNMLFFAEQVVHPQGLIFVSDLSRLKTLSVVEKFSAIMGADYGSRLRMDFFNSLCAAWLPEELQSAIPHSSARIWYSVVIGGLPFLQALIGLPEGRSELFENPGRDWLRTDLFPNEKIKQDWLSISFAMSQAVIRQVKSGQAVVKRVG